MKIVKYELSEDHKTVVSSLLLLLENKGHKDVIKGKDGKIRVWWKAGRENKEHSVENFSRLVGGISKLKSEYFMTDNDLKLIEFYISNTSKEIKKSSLFDVWSPLLVAFIFSFFGFIIGYQMNFFEAESAHTIYCISYVLLILGLFFRVSLIKRRSGFIARSLMYEQIGAALKYFYR